MAYIVDIIAITQNLGVNGPLDLTKSTCKSIQLSTKYFTSSHKKWCEHFFTRRRPSFADIKTYLSEIHMEERQRFEEQSKMETRRIQAMSWGSNGSDEDVPPPKVPANNIF